MPFNRQELADYLSVERSAMSAELSKLRDDGVLKFHKNQFELL
ncbi:helix-turn-helix domain-containing protein [Aminicella lysinilytica]